MALEDLTRTLDTLIKVAPRERILLTRNGKPFAFVSDASTLDWEDIGYIADPAFWKTIAERRREPTVPFAVVEAKLREDERRERIKRKTSEKRGR